MNGEKNKVNGSEVMKNKIIEFKCINCGTELDAICAHREFKYCNCLCHEVRYKEIVKMHLNYDENGDLIK